MKAAKDVNPQSADGEEDVPIQPKSIKALTSLMLKRTYDMFVGNHSQKLPLDEQAQRAKIASKVRSDRAFFLLIIVSMLFNIFSVIIYY